MADTRRRAGFCLTHMLWPAPCPLDTSSCLLSVDPLDRHLAQVASLNGRIDRADVRHVDTDEGLRLITRWLGAAGVAGVAGMLGGSDGYGARFGNDVFGMHPFCWCDRAECAWCRGCECPDEAHIYLVDSRVVDAGYWFDTGGYSGAGERRYRLDESLRCAHCRRGYQTPNFWHMPSRSAICWYKYIGRGMSESLHVPWPAILSDCLNSLLISEPGCIAVSTSVTAPDYGV